MKTQVNQVSPRQTHKHSSRKPLIAILANCPVGGAGWCPYPFSPKQLEKHLRHKMKEEESADTTQAQRNTSKVLAIK